MVTGALCFLTSGYFGVLTLFQKVQDAPVVSEKAICSNNSDATELPVPTASFGNAFARHAYQNLGPVVTTGLHRADCSSMPSQSLPVPDSFEVTILCYWKYSNTSKLFDSNLLPIVLLNLASNLQSTQPPPPSQNLKMASPSASCVSLLALSSPLTQSKF